MTDEAGRAFLEFLAGPEPYLVAVDAVIAAERVTRLTTVPNAPEWFDGSIRTPRGEIPLLGLAALLGHGPTPPLARARVLVVAYEKAEVGLRTDSGSRTVRVPERAIVVPTAAHHVAPWVAGIVQFAEQLVMVIDPRLLLGQLNPDCLRSLIARPPASV